MKKEQMIASRVSPDLIADLQKIEEVEHVDRSTAVRRPLYTAIRDWKLDYAAKLYAENLVTTARAAQEAGVSVREMMEYLRQKMVPMQYDVEDFEHDLKTIYGQLITGQQ
ncbi:MAG: UPF0175 family protein [Chloroflexi bacterium]|nr:UPF0175 family protein [Chloroflexota bacterium]